MRSTHILTQVYPNAPPNHSLDGDLPGNYSSLIPDPLILLVLRSLHPIQIARSPSF